MNRQDGLTMFLVFHGEEIMLNMQIFFWNVSSMELVSLGKVTWGFLGKQKPISNGFK